MANPAIGTNDATRKKNSGVLRYTFGNVDASNARSAQLASLVGGANPVILRPLGPIDNTSAFGADADSDNQCFGEFPGSIAITGRTNTLFTGSNPTAVDGVQARPIVIDSVTGNFVDPTLGRYPAYIPVKAPDNGALGFYSGGTKVYAWFQASSIDLGVSTAPGDVPAVVVQTEVHIGRFCRGGGVQDSDGPIYLSSIRVAIANQGGNASAVAGTLFVKLEHSDDDIPGSLTQSLDFAVVAA